MSNYASRSILCCILPILVLSLPCNHCTFRVLSSRFHHFIARFTSSLTQWTSSSDSDGMLAGHAGGSLLKQVMVKLHPQDYTMTSLYYNWWIIISVWSQTANPPNLIPRQYFRLYSIQICASKPSKSACISPLPLW